MGTGLNPSWAREDSEFLLASTMLDSNSDDVSSFVVCCDCGFEITGVSSVTRTTSFLVKVSVF